MIRHMAYVFPQQGFEDINDQFMLGNDLLVAPVVKQGVTTKNIRFPEGRWVGDDGSVVEGPVSLEVRAPLARLPWYRKQG